MTWTTVSHCPRCGAPIYVPLMWHGITPPSNSYSCNCFPEARQYLTTTNFTIPPQIAIHAPPKEMPNPTPMDLKDPVFEAIWSAIKSWDVNVPEHYVGYCGANGSHVKLIMQSLANSFAKAEKP